MSKWKIPLSDLNFDDREREAVCRVLASKWLTMGPEVERFEKEFASQHRVPFAMAISNATAGLHLALLALGIGKGDEVIQPAINFVASANMTVAVGATPVFADVSTVDTPTIDPFDIEARITPRTRAIIVMHYAGYSCDMKSIVSIAAKHNLPIIEDACHGIGGTYHDGCDSSAPVGSIGDIGVFSFFSNKNLATGEGGMVITKRADVADRIRLLRSHGMSTLTWSRHQGHAYSYDVLSNGFNYRMDEVHAALGRVQLEKLRDANLRRWQLTLRYRQQIAGDSRWRSIFPEHPAEAPCHLMVVLGPDRNTRDRARELLSSAGIQTSFHYPPIYSFSAFLNSSIPLKKTDDFSHRAITLPMYPTLREDQVDHVASMLVSTP